MGCRLYKEKKENEIELKNLNVGKIAVITDGKYKGMLIFKSGIQTDYASFILGDLDGDMFYANAHLRVRELNPGELIEVDYSE